MVGVVSGLSSGDCGVSARLIPPPSSDTNKCHKSFSEYFLTRHSSPHKLELTINFKCEMASSTITENSAINLSEYNCTNLSTHTLLQIGRAQIFLACFNTKKYFSLFLYREKRKKILFLFAPS